MSPPHDILDHIPHLRRYARALMGDAASADDLVQDCLERALGRWRMFRPTGSRRAWLFTIMHNLFVNQQVRRRRERQGDPEGQEAAMFQVAPSQDEQVAVMRLPRLLNELPPEQRQAVLLVGLEQMSYEEAAAVAQIPVGTLMSRLHRGRERLRGLLAGDHATTLRRVK